jgi:hypothetical protein
MLETLKKSKPYGYGALLSPADKRHIITESTDSDGEIYQAA